MAEDSLMREFEIPLKSTLEKIRNHPSSEEANEAQYCGSCTYGWIVDETGRAKECPCRSRRELGTRQARIDNLLMRHRAGLSKKLARVSPHTFLVRPGQEMIKFTLDKYIRDLEEGKTYGFFIYGDTGIGKSWAAAYVINSIRSRRIMISAMINFSRTLSALRGTFRDEDEHRALLSVLYDTPLLAIDDLGMEQRVAENPDLSWSVSKFYEIIDYRRDNELATIITSNRTPAELAERLGEPIMTRIQSLALRLDFPHEDNPRERWG